MDDENVWEYLNPRESENWGKNLKNRIKGRRTSEEAIKLYKTRIRDSEGRNNKRVTGWTPRNEKPKERKYTEDK